MTLSQARKRFPHVPPEVIRWAVENISDPREVEIGLKRIEDARRIQVKYAVAVPA